ncbi:ferrous iron transport protein B [Anseongella ginsenosidimutans]|uniref:Ferrous iron transport protein B n=1 Tax=Anseongella ginsenosidimutans TaxID=496056 RepID=A0A4R3KPP2_9SPHI|nr:ferrous iron transport protein B [Anseongella ginsenosidimutans]QEC52414.1 ferrous iron transport protein B [Anseongella ginsenosidimutans]TCS85842.1 ferrous iron transport protein B [Anseongella ginsenosidimutans]
MKTLLRVALIGNPNTGKSTVFNDLTGLNQKVGNFPGVTIDKKTGHCTLSDTHVAEVIDLPGIYSLYPKAKDEKIAFEVLADKKNKLYPDAVVVVADASNLKRNLLLFTQVADLKIPVVLALNMIDVAEKAGLKIDVDKLAGKLGVPVVPLNARNKRGIPELKETIARITPVPTQNNTINVEELEPAFLGELQETLNIGHPYEALQVANQYKNLLYLNEGSGPAIEKLIKKHDFQPGRVQLAETAARYNYIDSLLKECVRQEVPAAIETFTSRIDKILTHKVFGLLIFVLILFILFQSIFSLAEYPMSLIEEGFAWLSGWLVSVLPAGVLTDLLVDGIVAGLGGVVIFVPQIIILFAFIAILEDTGYMARVIFLMDRIMRKVGLNGRSVVPLISGIACAVPAIMATRSIENWKDRLITILVTPLMSCAARLPVYVLLISLVVPNERLWGVFNFQGLALLFMYLLGLVAAIGVAYIMKFIIGMRERSYLLMEMPIYRMPRWSNVGLVMYERALAFVVQAGKVIIAVSIILWVLATYGPSDKMQAVEAKYASAEMQAEFTPEEIEHHISSEKLENSYAGILGKTIEPVIEPLGFDWKIGIALITSFAAREVFVGTMATIYSVEADDSHMDSVREKMLQARNAQTGLPVFTLATAFSLMVFYAFAMQCMSTLAIVQRETKSWKWPVIQLVYMTGMAYLGSLITYQLLS